METWLATRLLTGTLHGAFVVVLVWLTCRAVRGIPAPVQAGLWWLTSLKLLVVFLPLPAVALPLLPAPALPAAANLARDIVPTRPVLEPPLWLSIVLVCWASGLLVQTVRLGVAFRRLRGIIGRATPLPEGDRATASELARAVGLRRCPEVRISNEIPGPLVSGIRRPIVLRPSALARADWRVAICHEFVHVRRHDLALGWVPALAERLFFFHPLARLAAREYVTAREAACDAGVLRALDVSAGDYARLLVNLGIAHAGPLPAAGGAPTSKSSLRRRLDMLHHPLVHGRNRHAWWLLTAAAVLVLVPFELSARQAPGPAAVPAEPLTAVAVAPAPGTAVRPDEPLIAFAVAPAPRQAPAPGSVARPVARAERPQEARPVAQEKTFFESAKQIEAAERQLEAVHDEYKKFVETYNKLAAQNARAAQVDEETRRRRERESTAAFIEAQRDTLAAQQGELTRHIRETEAALRILAEQQKQLAEAMKNLTRETERLGNAVSPRR